MMVVTLTAGYSLVRISTVAERSVRVWAVSVYRSFSGQRYMDVPHRNFLKMKLRDEIRSLCQGLVLEYATEASAAL